MNYKSLFKHVDKALDLLEQEEPLDDSFLYEACQELYRAYTNLKFAEAAEKLAKERVDGNTDNMQEGLHS